MAEGRDREEFKRSYAAHARANARVCSLGKEPDVTSSRVCLPPSSLTNESSQYVCGALLLLDGIRCLSRLQAPYTRCRERRARWRGLSRPEPVSAANTLVATRHERSALNLRFTRND